MAPYRHRFFMGSSLDSNDNRAYLTILIQHLSQKEITVLLNFWVLILMIEIVVTKILTNLLDTYVPILIRS